MNVLYLCDEYPPAKTGGIGTATKIVAEGLAERGHNVYVLSARIIERLPEKSVINGVVVYRMFILNKFAKLLYDKNLFCKLSNFLLRKTGILSRFVRADFAQYNYCIESIIAKNDIQIVEVPDFGIFSNYVNLAKITPIKHNIPTIVRVHGSLSFLEYYNNEDISYPSYEYDKALLHTADRIVCVSEFSASFVHEVLGIGKKLDVVYNPLTIVQDKNNSTVTSRDNTVVFLGKIVETKGAFNLLKAFNEFSQKFPEYELIMIGGGNIDYAKSIVDVNTRDKVQFTGYIRPDEIARFLSSSSFCVIPSFFETFGIAAIEAMSFANILIYTNTSSGPELIEDGKNGFLVNPYDVTEIIEKMNYVANHITELQYVRRNARNSVLERFSKNVIIEKLLKIYDETISNYAQ